MGHACICVQSTKSYPAAQVWPACCSGVCLSKMFFSSFLALHCGKSSGICGVVLIQETFWKQ